MADPFNKKIVSPCVPDLYDFPSKKIRTLSRGTFFLGTDIGYILVNPLAGFSYDVIRGTATNASYASSAIAAAYGNSVNNSIPANTTALFNGQNPK